MFPTLSVTLIGLLVGAAVMLVTRTGWSALLVGPAGAWVGFGIGALLGLAADVVLGTGVWVALGGHVLALVGGVDRGQSPTRSSDSYKLVRLLQSGRSQSSGSASGKVSSKTLSPSS